MDGGRRLTDPDGRRRRARHLRKQAILRATLGLVLLLGVVSVLGLFGIALL